MLCRYETPNYCTALSMLARECPGRDCGGCALSLGPWFLWDICYIAWLRLLDLF